MKFQYYQLLEWLYHRGSFITTRGLTTRELTGVNLVVDDYNFFATPEYRPFDEVWKYYLAETAWYLSGERTLDKITPYSKFWGNIRNADDTINSNYGDLVFYRKNEHGVNSFDWALDCLKEDINTRKAIILYNDRCFFHKDTKDLICNQYQHLLIRNNQLICFVALRSSDAIFGLQYNIPWWSYVQQQAFLKLKIFYPNLQLGSIEAFISSSHIYENKFGMVEGIINSDEKQRFFIRWHSIVPLKQTFEWYFENLHKYFSVEKIR